MSDTAAQPQADGSKGHILVVDDDEFVQSVVSAALERLGYQISVVASGEDAVSFYEQNHGAISLIILDMIMPTMDGRTTFFELKRINPDLRVVLASGFAVDEDAEECMGNGALEFLRKPFSLTDLSRVVTAHVLT